MRNLVQYRSRQRINTLEGLDNFFASFLSEPVFRDRRPIVDVREEGDGYLVQAELPGVIEGDLKVSVHDCVLTIVAKIGEDKEHEANSYLVRERCWSDFTRSFVLPSDAENDGITAEFKQGLLTLQIPKAESSKARDIKINAA